MKYLWFISSLLLLPVRLFCQTGENLRHEIEKFIRFETDIDFEKTPGFIVGVVDGDSTFVLPFGSIRTDTVIPPNEHTVFELGSLTNVFTATLVSTLASEGVLHLDSSINRYLLSYQQNQNAGDLTLLNFLTHTTGLPRLPFGIGIKEQDPDQPFANYTTDDLFGFFSNYIFGKNDKGRYTFSHVNYAILETAIENTVGQPYEVWLAQKVLRPLEMNETRVYLTSEIKSSLATGFDKAGNPAPPWQFQSFQGAVGLKSSMHDLLNFLRANLNPPPGIVLPPLGKNCQGIFPTDIRKDTWIAAGWHVIRRKKKPSIITHTGATSGHRAAMAFNRETKTGVVILANSPFGLDGLEFLILDMISKGKQ